MTTNCTIKKSENEAILFAANQITPANLFFNSASEVLKNENFLIRNTSCDCACGESCAIELTYFEGEKQTTEIVGVCENCGE